MRQMILTLLIALFAVIMLAACGGGGATSDPADVALRFLTAKAAGDGEALRALICAEREATWEAEAASFGSVEARLEDASCTRQGETNVVTCTGAIVAVYGTETNSFPLASYTMTMEDGEYKWCGEA